MASLVAFALFMQFQAFLLGTAENRLPEWKRTRAGNEEDTEQSRQQDHIAVQTAS